MRAIGKIAVSAAALAASAGTLHAQRLVSSTVRAYTDKSGTWLRPEFIPGARPVQQGSPDSILWTFVEPVAIPNSCALSQGSGKAWAGEQLNNERLQAFNINGTGTPLNEYPCGPNSPVVCAAAVNGDFAVVIDQLIQDGPLQIRAYRSNSTTALWIYDVQENYKGTGYHNLRVSRDGSTVVAAVVDQVTGIETLLTLNANDGSLRSQWVGAVVPPATLGGGCSGVEVTDDGSKAIICEGSPPAGIGRLINTTNGTQITTFPGNGGGGWFNISGNGNVIVIGGFSLRVYVWNGTAYQIKINFSAAGSWFSSGSAVSRDGSTVGALSHVYTANYLNTDVRIWDVAGAELLGTVSTIGSGGFQDSAVGGVMSDDGSRFAVASWGEAGQVHPEVRVFSRNLQLLGSIDTPGSPFCLDMTGDGQYILTGFKSVHANTFGNGGGVTLLQIPVAACYPNCDGSTIAPALNVADYICFMNRYAAGDSYANCDGSTIPPVLNVSDYICFTNRYAAGCP